MEFKKGDKVFLSERGHNYFFYPTHSETKILCKVDAKQMSWNCGNPDYVAFLVPEHTVKYSGKSGINIPIWKKKNRPL